MLKMFQKREKRSMLEIEIDDLLLEMSVQKRDSEDYKRNINYLSKLYEAKEFETPKAKVSPDTVVVVLTNLAGILLILYFEKLDTITSRAINFIVKGRV